MSEFIIENDVLKKYTGSDRHVVVPDGIKKSETLLFPVSFPMTLKDTKIWFLSHFPKV